MYTRPCVTLAPPHSCLSVRNHPLKKGPQFMDLMPQPKPLNFLGHQVQLPLGVPIPTSHGLLFQAFGILQIPLPHQGRKLLSWRNLFLLHGFALNGRDPHSGPMWKLGTSCPPTTPKPLIEHCRHPLTCFVAHTQSRR